MKQQEKVNRAWLIRLYAVFFITSILFYLLLYTGIINLENRVTKIENKLENQTFPDININFKPQPEDPFPNEPSPILRNFENLKQELKEELIQEVCT